MFGADIGFVYLSKREALVYILMDMALLPLKNIMLVNSG